MKAPTLSISINIILGILRVLNLSRPFQVFLFLFLWVKWKTQRCLTHHLLTLPSLYFAARFFFHFRGILPSVREIFSREGIQGFFAGMTPRLIGEVLALVISGSAAFAVNQFVKRGRTREYISLGVSVTFILTIVSF